ncbi:GAF domain-containing protein [Streptomyces olivaceus]|uniref:sensor histidine kinase n=1 Tax=Streptomyces olivaceus TaxID=47716 RepID=UPI0018A85981|nr:GAF domain-containing protein [Streptomyces olivaceus]MBF8171241.1 GAF domain-containing protein [Streptomyces olivaceus]
MAPVPLPGPPSLPEGASAEFLARVPKLLDAMRSVGGGRELRSTLSRICETAADLTGARCAALGVLDEDGDGLADFVHHGLDEATARRAGHLPGGRKGLLGALVTDPEPVRSTGPPGDPGPGGSPEHRPPTRSFLGVPVKARGQTFGHLYLTGKHTAEPFNDYDLALVRVLATEAGLAIGNARLHEAAQQRERWIDGSVAVTTALLAGGDTDDALQEVAEQARRLSGAAAGIVLLPADGGGLEIAAVAAPHRTNSLGVVIPPENGIVAELLSGHPLFVDDAATDPRLEAGPVRAYGPIMLLPLCRDGRVLGGLVMPRARGERPFTRTERALGHQFASQAALALTMADAQRDRERLAVFEDRDRIARDLHDLVIQRLFATGMMLGSAQRRAAVPEVRDGVGAAVDELDVTIQEIRSAIFALQQPAEAPAGLRTRVLREISMAAVPLGFTPSHRFTGPVDTAVGDLTGKNLIAALRETLSNAFRHAHATRIEVAVDATAVLPDGRRGVRLTVSDDGVGVPEGGRRSGLHNLRRRAESVGGASRLGPGIAADGGGTTVWWEAPY